MSTDRVRELADRLGGMDRRAAGDLGDALMRALGIRVRTVVVAPAKPAEPEVVEERTEFSVVLLGFDEGAKLAVIREVRAGTGLGLAESKRVVEGSADAPATLRGEMSKSDAEAMASVLRAAGARVELV